jgi:nucleoside-diphosphate-sugar epimerase
MKTLITGAAGFIGCHLLEELMRTRNKDDIYCLSRQESSCDILKQKGVNVIKGDLDNKSILNSLFKNLDIEIVYHLAASARINRPWKEYLINNIVGTRNIMECIQEYGRSLKKVIYMSSILAGPGHTSLYGESKRLTEGTVIQTCQKTGVAYCILRAPIVYGPGNKADGGLMKIASAIRKKNLFSQLNFPGVCSLLYIRDLVRFCLLAEENEMANNQILYIYSDQRVTLEEIMDKIAMALNMPRQKIKLPILFYRLIHATLPLLSRCFSTGANTADFLGLLLNDSWVCGRSCAEELLKFKPNYKLNNNSLREALGLL